MDEDDWWSDTQALLLGDEPTPDVQPSDDLQDTAWFTREEATEAVVTPALPRRSHDVTAILVSHDGAVWLPAMLTTLAAQTHPPTRVVGVDTGSTDGSADLLRAALGDERVIVTDRDAGFGTAAALGIALDAPPPQPDVVSWIWLLHDDAAPDATCLDALLQTADAHPSAAILGPKILGWHDRRLLLEAGFSITASGRRFTGLERREHDQGQHDGVRDVMAVSSAGMLVRRDVWEQLGGFDPALPLFRDDLDFCWRARRAGERVLVATDAVLHHREASAHGRRSRDHLAAHPHRADREAGVHVLLAHASTLVGPLQAAWLILQSALRAIGFVLGKDLRAARDEVTAVLDIAVHPGRLGDSRERIARTSVHPASVASDLRPHLLWQLRQSFEALVGILSTSGSTVDTSVSALESGPIDEDAAYLPNDSSHWMRRLLWRPSVLLVALLTVFSVAVTIPLWAGSGTLQGGALLPVDGGASDLWASYLQAWHDVGPGSYVPAAPYLLVVWGLSVLLLGKAWLAVSVMLLLVVPLAGWAAYMSLRGVIASDAVRVVAAATYALLPAVTASVSTGRLSTAVVAVILPFLVRSFIRIGRGGGTMRRAAGTALLLSVAVAAMPGIWILAIVFALMATAWGWRHQGRTAAVALRRVWLAVLAPFVLLMPWSFWLVANPTAFLFPTGAKSSYLTDPELAPWDVLLLHPGGPGMTPTWTTVAIVAAALLAFMRRDRLIIVTAAWAVALPALLLGVLQTVWAVAPPGSTVAMRPWPGSSTLVLGAAMIAAAAFAADGLRRRLSRANFTLFTPIAVVVAIGAIVTPLLLAAWWAPIATGVMSKGPISVVPAFVAADAAGPAAPRTLLLEQDLDGRVRYSLVNGAGPTLGDADVAPPSEVWQPLDVLVAQLASGRGGEEVDGLAAYGVRYVVLAGSSVTDLTSVLDGQSGLRRLSSSGGEVLWRIAGVTSRVQAVADGDAEVVPVVDGANLTSNPYVERQLGTGPDGRVLALGVQAHDGWQVLAINGEDATPLEPIVAPGVHAWSQAVALPAGEPTVRVDFEDAGRATWLVLQGIAIAVAIVLALPARRVEDLDPDDEGDAA